AKTSRQPKGSWWNALAVPAHEGEIIECRRRRAPDLVPLTFDSTPGGTHARSIPTSAPCSHVGCLDVRREGGRAGCGSVLRRSVPHRLPGGRFHVPRHGS